MSTTNAHDFYDGRGPDATYLGSIVAHPLASSDPLPMLDHLVHTSDQGNTYAAATWRTRVYDLLKHRSAFDGVAFTDDDSQAAQLRAWPHGHIDSRGTEWAWFFDHGAIYLHHWGALTAVFYPNGGSKTRLRFPTFDQNGG